MPLLVVNNKVLIFDLKYFNLYLVLLRVERFFRRYLYNLKKVN